MKVEKCPCGITHEVYHAKKVKRWWILCEIFNIQVTRRTRFGTILRYNLWARREAKRIAKEGATK